MIQKNKTKCIQIKKRKGMIRIMKYYNKMNMTNLMKLMTKC